MAAAPTHSRSRTRGTAAQAAMSRVSAVGSVSAGRARQRMPSLRMPSPSQSLVYPDKDDVLVLEPRQLPVLTSAPPSPSRSRSGSGSSTGSSSSSSGSSARQHDDDDGDYSLEAELASALADDDGGRFFSSTSTTTKPRSPSVATVTPAPAWPGVSASKAEAAAQPASEETASASASSTSLRDADDDVSLPSTASTTLSTVEDAWAAADQAAAAAASARTPKMPPPPFLFVQAADDEDDDADEDDDDDDDADEDEADDEHDPAPSLPSPPRGIPSLPPRVDISDFGIYSPAPSPLPSPTSTPPSNTRTLPSVYAALNAPGRAGTSASARGNSSSLAIPDHLPPLNLPQTPLSLPSVLPDITLTAAAAADLAPLSLLSSRLNSLLVPSTPSAPTATRRHTDPGSVLGLAQGQGQGQGQHTAQGGEGPGLGLRAGSKLSSASAVSQGGLLPAPSISLNGLASDDADSMHAFSARGADDGLGQS